MYCRDANKLFWSVRVVVMVVKNGGIFRDSPLLQAGRKLGEFTVHYHGSNLASHGGGRLEYCLGVIVHAGYDKM